MYTCICVYTMYLVCGFVCWGDFLLLFHIHWFYRARYCVSSTVIERYRLSALCHVLPHAQNRPKQPIAWPWNLLYLWETYIVLYSIVFHGRGTVHPRVWCWQSIKNQLSYSAPINVYWSYCCWNSFVRSYVRVANLIAWRVYSFFNSKCELTFK